MLVRGEATLAVVANKLTCFWMSEDKTVRASRCGNNSGHIIFTTAILHRRFLAGVHVHRYGADLEQVHKVNTWVKSLAEEEFIAEVGELSKFEHTLLAFLCSGEFSISDHDPDILRPFGMKIRNNLTASIFHEMSYNLFQGRHAKFCQDVIPCSGSLPL